jgi:hypothetical protein
MPLGKGENVIGRIKASICSNTVVPGRVIRANILANVTAENPAVQVEVIRNLTPVFNGLVRYAFIRVNYIFISNCSSWAGRDAQRAAAAKVFDRGVIRIELDISNNITYKEP